MQNLGPHISSYGLENLGIQHVGKVYWNLPVPTLYEESIKRGESVMAQGGPLLVRTGNHTGRSPNDKFTVKEATSENEIWWGSVNRPISQAHFDGLHHKMLAYMQNRDLFVFDGYAGADKAYQMPVRVVNEYAWHNLFARNMFIEEGDGAKLESHVPQFTVIDMPRFKADPAVDGTSSSTFILVDFGKRLVLIGGTEYGGEIKKSIFAAMNYYLPKQGVMSMHCSANYGETKADTALFFGLSGTGKTTLSNDPARHLIGDDEHGWSDDGVFNFEGGCYAKVIRLDPEGEPEIYSTTHTFGTLLENVEFAADSRLVNLDSDKFTENTRSSYPLTQLTNADLSGTGDHPRNIFFLTADAFGVMPPISKLNKAQAMYHFLSGYTAKVAGTERGVTEPKATFSACFGAPFMPLHPGEYAKLLGEKIDKHGAQVWLVNTGWTGGPYGVGNRMKLAYTRRTISAALNGELDSATYVVDPTFGFAVPTSIEGIPDEVLNPRLTWADKEAYDAQAVKLAQMFNKNFKTFADGVTDEIKAAAPTV